VAKFGEEREERWRFRPRGVWKSRRAVVVRARGQSVFTGLWVKGRVPRAVAVRLA